MSISTPGVDIRSDVITRLGYGSGFTSNTDVKLTDVNSMIVQSSRELGTLIRSSDFGDDFFLTHDVVALNGTKGYVDVTTDLTDNFLRLRKVAWLKSSSEKPTPLHRASIDETYIGGIETSAWSQSGPVYRLTKGRINFYPPPSSTVIVIVSYDSDLGLESDLSNSILLYPGWREWIVLDVCRKICTREKDLVSARMFASERDEKWEQISRLASQRDDWEPEAVRDLWK